MAGLNSLSRGVFDALTAGMTIRKFDGLHPRDPGIAKMFGIGNMTASGVKVSHDSTMAIPAIYRAMNIIANGVSRVPFYVFKNDDDGGRQFSKGHTSWKAVAIEPHPEIKMVDFRRVMTSWAIGWGNAVAHIRRPQWPYGGLVELTPLLPDRTIPVRITERMVKNYGVDQNLLGILYYQTKINDIEISYPATDCLHIRGLGPNPYWGYDIVEVLAQAIGGASARAEFGHRFYGQGANPAGFIELGGSMDEESEKRFVESVRRGMEGMGKAHRMMVLEEGAKFHQWTIDPAKAQFLEGMQFDYRVLANVVGIKVHKLIDGANSAYASLEQANSEHRDDDLLPWIMQWTGEYNAKMLTQLQRDGMTHEIGVDDEYLEGFVPFKDRADGVVMLKNNDMITRNEGRRRLNWGPSKDRNGSRFTIPMNIEFTDEKMSLGEMASIKQNTPQPDDDPEDDPVVDDDEAASEDASAELSWTYDCRKGCRGDVYLNGVAVERVVACDVLAGRVLVQPLSESGELVIVGSGIEMTVLYGDVLFIPNEFKQKYETIIDAMKESFATVEHAWIAKIKTRLGKQATKLSEKTDPSEFITWVDRLASEAAPGELQSSVDGFYATIRDRFLALIDSPPTNTRLSVAVASEVASWSTAENETN